MLARVRVRPQKLASQRSRDLHQSPRFAGLRRIGYLHRQRLEHVPKASIVGSPGHYIGTWSSTTKDHVRRMRDLRLPRRTPKV